MQLTLSALLALAASYHDSDRQRIMERMRLLSLWRAVDARQRSSTVLGNAPDRLDQDPVHAGRLTVAIGIGCDRGAAWETVAGCVDAALQQLEAPRVLMLASVMQKRDEAAIQALAAERGWPLCFYPAAELAQIPVANPSETVLRILGTPAVAEAAALRAAGADLKGLLVEKQTYRGIDGKTATVAIAGIH